ncbi:MAG: hypothetical protein MEP57_09605 [Microvirga sp.]|nr:hypothetical protein [Microvirga sp.]
MLRRILHALRRAVAALFRLPLRLLGAVFGGKGGVPEPAPFDEAVEEQLDELRDAMEAPKESPGIAAATLGERVHAYVSGDRADRDAYDMDQLPEHVGIALLTLPEGARLRLAQAGQELCGRWALGERTELVGVPLCKMRRLAEGRQEERRGRPVLVPPNEAPSETAGLAFA